MTSPVTVDPTTGVAIFVGVSILAVIAMVAIYIDASRRDVNHAGLLSVVIGFLFLLYALPGIAACVMYLLMRDELAGTSTVT